MAILDVQAADLLRKATAVGDATLDVYLDTERLVVVKVKDGQCVPADLVADDVEKNEDRFAEIPVVTTMDEYLWMQDFVEDLGERRITGLLDGRSGANARFLKQLGKQAPETLAAWEAYRTERVAAMVNEWFVALGIAEEA